MVAEDSKVQIAIEPPQRRAKKMIARIAYEVYRDNPYRYTEEQFHHEVHVVRRKMQGLKIESYDIKRSPLLKEYGWGIHRNKEGKLALIPMESEKYRELQNTIKTAKAYNTRRK